MVFKMFKKRIILALISFLAILMFFNGSCSNGFSLDNKLFPRFRSEERMDAAVETTESFFQALRDKDHEKAYDLISDKDKAAHSFDDFEKELRDVTEIMAFKVNWVEVRNNIALVGIDITDYYDGSEKLYKDLEISLIDEEDTWKINFWQ